MVAGKRQGKPTKPRQKAKGANPEAISEEDETISSTELSDDQRHALTARYANQWDQANAVLEEAKKKRGSIETEIKEMLGKNGVKDVKDYIKLREPEGEVEIQTDIERRLRLARWQNAKIGQQLQMFEDRTTATDKAFEEGKGACFRDEPRKPPYAPSVPQHEAWLKGYQAGQDVIMKGFTKPAPEPIGPEEKHVTH